MDMKQTEDHLEKGDKSSRSETSDVEADRADAAPTARTDTFLRFLQWTFVWFLARALFFLLAHEALIRVYLYFDFGWERDKLERLYGLDWKPVFVVNGASTIGANASWRHYKRFMGIK